jgi:acyl-CoA synthetase (NDP forming)
LVEGLPLLAKLPIRAGEARAPAVGVVTTTAGGATMVIDPLASRGVRVEAPSAQTLARLSAAGIDVAPARLIDLTVAGTRYDVMKAALDILTTAPEFDLLVAVVGSSARFHPELAVRPIVDSAKAPKPIAAFLVPDAPEALAQLSQAGVPNFRTPEACADAVAATLSRRSPKPIMTFSQPEVGGAGRMLDELAAYALLDRINIPRAPSLAVGADIRELPALPFPYPVAVKALSADIAHKSDVGGVALGIDNAVDLLAAIAGIRKAVHVRTGLQPDRMIIQPMIAGLGEVLIGYRVDRDVGPLVMVAAGGIMTEIMRDRSLRLAPVDIAEARDMISEVRALKVLTGVRGRPAGDLDALARAIVALSKIATMTDPAISEAEINPLIVLPSEQGVVAVDALVKVSEKG